MAPDPGRGRALRVEDTTTRSGGGGGGRHGPVVGGQSREKDYLEEDGGK